MTDRAHIRTAVAALDDPSVKREISRKPCAEREALWSLIREAADLLSTEADALREGVGINGVMQAQPADQHTVDAIREIEGWLGRVAAMQRGGG